MQTIKGLNINDIIHIDRTKSEFGHNYIILPNRFNIKYENTALDIVKQFLRDTEEFKYGIMDFTSCDEFVKGHSSKMYKEIQSRIKK